jgi:hypothetical protein
MQYIHRLARAFTLTGGSPDAAPDPFRVLLATPLTIQLDFKNLSMNLDPFAGVGSIPIRRPIAPGRIKYLKTINPNDDDFRDSLEQELQGFSPLQRKDSGRLLERGFQDTNWGRDDRVDDELEPGPRTKNNHSYKAYDLDQEYSLLNAQMDNDWSLAAYPLVIFYVVTFFINPILYFRPGLHYIYPLGRPRYDGHIRASDFQNIKSRRWLMNSYPDWW